MQKQIKMIINNHKHGFWWIIFTFCLILCCFGEGKAQVGQNLEISPPNTDQYPTVSIYLDVFDQTGSPVQGVSGEQIELYENGEKIDLESFQEISPGIQLVFAINVAPPLGIQDVLGNSRLSYIQQAISAWLNDIPAASTDDLSIISNDGLETTHQDNPSAILTSLESYEPLPRDTTADLSVLSRAIELASDPVDQIGMKKVVLLFTPPPSPQEIGAIESLITLAVESQVRVYPILISSPAFFSSEGALILQQMAAETGGDYFTYAGTIESEEGEDEDENEDTPPPDYESLPDFNILLDRFRLTYQLTFQSQIVTTGNHLLEVKGGTETNPVTVSREYYLEVEPPNPVLLNPPREITRQNMDPDQPDTPISDYQPDSLALEVLLEFPDGHPRDLTETILRVNGEIAARKTSEPFDQFTWDISQINNPGIYYLTVEAVDELGLSRMSLRTPIEVVIDTPTPSVTTVFNENRIGFYTLAVILTLGLGFLVMIVRGVIQPKSFPGKNKFFSKSTQQKDPERVEGSQESKTPRWSKRIEPDEYLDLQPKESSIRLISINEVARQTHPQPFFLQKQDLFVGGQSSLAELIVHHHSISDRHAQLIWDAQENTFAIQDLKSASGTWLNYDQLDTEQKHLLKNGDIIHFGQAGFRYQQAE